MNKDLTVGKPSQVLWQFCLPMFGSIIFQQLYNIADSLVAGKFIGENALAAVGNSYEITLIFIAFAFGCNIGCSVIVSRYFGAKEYGEMKTSVYTSLIGSAVLCAVLMVIGLRSTKGKTLTVTLAVRDIKKQAEAGERFTPDTLPANAPHAEFVKATDAMNARLDALDLNTVEIEEIEGPQE